MNETIEILRNLVPFGKERNGNLQLLRHIEGLFKECGLEVTLVSIPGSQSKSLVARIGPKAPGGIVLSAHTDVVPADDASLWTSGNPWEMTEEDGVLVGRGVLDNLGAVALILAQLPKWAALAHAGELKKPIYVVLTGEEEPDAEGRRSRGMDAAAKFLYEDLEAEPELCMVMMPTDGKVVSSQPTQLLGFNIACTALGGLTVNPVGNASTMAAFVQVALFKKKEELKRKGLIVSEGRLHIDEKPGDISFVPKRSTVMVDVRMQPGMTAEEACRIIQDLASEAVKEAGALQKITILKRFRMTAIRAQRWLFGRCSDQKSKSLEVPTNRSGEVSVSFNGVNAGFRCEDAAALELAKHIVQVDETVPGGYQTEAPGLGPKAVVWGPGKLSGVPGFGGAHARKESFDKKAFQAAQAGMDRIGGYCSQKPAALIA
jgi:acetylornithine deacetylase/succinyl-diaminopimelate desuccinylase-like protein